MAAAAPAASSLAPVGPSVAVIGCGPGGMFFLRQLEKERERLLELKERLEATNSIDSSSSSVSSIDDQLRLLPRTTVYEKESRCGGLWQSKRMAPADEKKKQKNNAGIRGKDPSSEGMYDGMWINAPKEIFEFEDYTFDEHFGGVPMPSYLTRHQVLEYLEGATNGAIEKHAAGDDATGSILFDTQVDWIQYDNTTGLFSVDSVDTGTLLNADTNEYEPEDLTTRTFDKVVFATGENNLPNIPSRESVLLKGGTNGSSNSSIVFEKPVLHSSQIKSLGGDIAGKTFLFIGAAFSAEDLALSFIKRGANHIYVTTRGDTGYPVAFTNSWPMDKVTVLMRTEIKEVLGGSTLRMGRMDLPSPGIEQLVRDFYDPAHENLVLEHVDAVVFCTGYSADDDTLDNPLKACTEENPDLKSHHEEDHWPNIYDPEVFDPENGLVLPTELPENKCGKPLHANNGMLRANPEKEFFYDQPGTFHAHLVSNPGFFYHLGAFDTPLLNLDIQSAHILKVMLGRIPTPDTKEEAYALRSLEMMDWLRNSNVRYFYDDVYALASVRFFFASIGTDDTFDTPYKFGFEFFKLFFQAREAGHPAGSMLVEVKDPGEESPLPLPREQQRHRCSDGEYLKGLRYTEEARGDKASRKWAFSDRGIVFLKQYIDFYATHESIANGTNQTFRDILPESYQSIYTGRKPARFSKLWMEVDDILGDVALVPGAGDCCKKTSTSTSSEGGCVDIDDTNHKKKNNHNRSSHTITATATTISSIDDEALCSANGDCLPSY